MSGSLNIYPFQDIETGIRFGIQVSLFLIGLVITNRLIIKPALRLQAEREKRTTGNQLVAQDKSKIADTLEQTYNTAFAKALAEVREILDKQRQEVKDLANQIFLNSKEKSAQYIENVKSNLVTEKQQASSQIHLHVNDIVNDIYSQLGISQ